MKLFIELHAAADFIIIIIMKYIKIIMWWRALATG